MGKVHALMARRQLARGEMVEVGHKQPEVEVAERIPLVEVGVVRVLQMAVERREFIDPFSGKAGGGRWLTRQGRVGLTLEGTF